MNKLWFYFLQSMGGKTLTIEKSSLSINTLTKTYCKCHLTYMHHAQNIG